MVPGMEAKMSDRAAGLTSVREVYSWDSGGGLELDVIELDDGTVIAISDETIALYASIDDLAGDGTSLVSVLRPSGDIVDVS